MPKFQIVLATVASINVEVEADDEDAAVERAYDAALEFSDRVHSGQNWSADVNETWQLEDPTVKEIPA